MTKRILLINSLVCGFFALGAFLLIYPIVKVSRPHWPKINDPNLLIAECSKLIVNDGEISKSEWPESVKALNPISISVYENSLAAIISSGGIDAAWGYLIYPDKRTETVPPGGKRILGIEHPGIFRYETIESVLPSTTSMSEKQEVEQYVYELKSSWNAGEYQQAKDKIDTMLTANPGWIPAVILESAYYRYIKSDCSKALEFLASIETAVNNLDPDIYSDFLAGYAIYKSALETEALQIFTEQEKEARLGLAQEIYDYFPGTELVALYYLQSGQ